MFDNTNNQAPSYALIYQSELDLISRWVLDYPNIETGGDFFGFWTHLGNPVVQFAIGPGPNVRRTFSFFNQDADYLIECGKQLRQHHGLLHMGEWHSHHRLGLAHPSGHDCDTVSSCIDAARIPRFLLTICTIDPRDQTQLNGFLFKRRVNGYEPIPWVVLPGKSPVRTHMETCSDIHREPSTKTPSLTNLATISLDQPLPVYEKAAFAPGSWTDSSEGQLTLKAIQDRFQFSYGKADLSLADDGRVIMRCQKDHIQAEILFPQQYPDKPFDIVLTDAESGKTLVADMDWKTTWQDIPLDKRLDLIDRHLADAAENKLMN